MGWLMGVTNSSAFLSTTGNIFNMSFCIAGYCCQTCITSSQRMGWSSQLYASRLAGAWFIIMNKDVPFPREAWCPSGAGVVLEKFPTWCCLRICGGQTRQLAWKMYTYAGYALKPLRRRDGSTTIMANVHRFQAKHGAQVVPEWCPSGARGGAQGGAHLIFARKQPQRAHI